MHIREEFARHPASTLLCCFGPKVLGGKKIALRGGGGGGTEAHFPNPPPPSLAAVTGGGGFRAGVPDLPCRGGGSTQHLWLKMIPTSR